MDRGAKAKLIAELEAIDSIQDRIDVVAADFESKNNRFAPIDGWTLGELLGINFEDVGGGRIFGGIILAQRRGAQFPFAENLELLEPHITDERYAQLTRQAAKRTDASKQRDLRLTVEEKELLEEAYGKAHSSQEGVQTAYETLQSSSGVELDFEVVFDADGPIRACSFTKTDSTQRTTSCLIEWGRNNKRPKNQDDCDQETTSSRRRKSESRDKLP